jgi:hypothetical protein
MPLNSRNQSEVRFGGSADSFSSVQSQEGYSPVAETCFPVLAIENFRKRIFALSPSKSI